MTPTKIICVGMNYTAHIEELNNTVPDNLVLFMKPNASIGSELHSQHDGQQLHYEGELCFMYQDGTFAAAGFGLDITKRALQSRLKEKGHPWERSKAFACSALFSAFRPIPDHTALLSIRLEINGQVVQSSDTEHMIYKPDIVLQEIRSFMPLEDGDIIMTGTPAGVGEIHAGDELHGSILQGGSELVSADWTAQ